MLGAIQNFLHARHGHLALQVGQKRKTVQNIVGFICHVRVLFDVLPVMPSSVTRRLSACLPLV